LFDSALLRYLLFLGVVAGVVECLLRALCYLSHLHVRLRRLLHHGVIDGARIDGASSSRIARVAKIFDGHQVSFIAVTQQFNTTTSMGRLTLNVLLSFAQFEREVTGERIRDKIAACKRKGI